MSKEVLNSENALSHVHNTLSENNSEQSLNFTSVTSLSNKNVHDSTEKDEVKQMIKILQQQIDLQTKSSNSKISRNVPIRNVTIQGNCKRCNTTKYC